jgi:hypothetical protein
MGFEALRPGPFERKPRIVLAPFSTASLLSVCSARQKPSEYLGHKIFVWRSSHCVDQADAPGIGVYPFQGSFSLHETFYPF